MKWVQHVQTMDGKLHHDYGRAKCHAENVYGLALTKLAQAALRCEKYTPMLEFIDANLDEFVQLKALKDDITLEPEEKMLPWD